MGQGQNKGPDSPLGDEPARHFSKDITPEEQKELMFKIQNRLDEYVKKLSKPNGEKNTPARTCSDLFATYPEKPSGKWFKYFFLSFGLD